MTSRVAWRGCALGLGVLVLASACARQVAPPGGPEDPRPPVVIRTVPEPLVSVTDLGMEIRFEFDERISERMAGGTLDDAITISPRSGDVRVKHARRALSLSVDGGLRPGIVYRVTLNAVVSDMFGNRLVDPFELVFSTGGDPIPTTLAGEIWNRVSGRPVADASLRATGPDSLVHLSATDREGIFAFRYLPAGPLDVTAFEDVNRDGEVDSTEVQGMATATLATGDTLLLDIAVLAPDTLAAIATGAEALDSVTVAVEFDDYLEPSLDVTGVAIEVARADGTAPTVARVFEEGAYAVWVDSVAAENARLDSIEAAAAAAAAPPPPDPISADSGAVVDSLALPDPLAPPDTVVVDPPTDTNVGVASPNRPGRIGPPRLAPITGTAPAGPTRDGRRVLPGRRLIAILASPLSLDTEYEVTVRGVLNINQLPGGGGVVPLIHESPPVDSIAVDTLAVDTLRADTLLVDTLAVDTPGR